MPTSKLTLFYQSSSEEKLNNREIAVPAGGVLGGGSSMNMMMYARAQRSDWNAWEVPEWSADDMIPYLRKVYASPTSSATVSQKFTKPLKLETHIGRGPKAVHGSDGPIVVSEGTHRAHVATKDYIQAAGQVGFPEIEDLSALDYCNGVQPALHTIDTDGLRQDTALKYIHPKIQSGKYPGLNVLVDTQVKRVVFEGKKATGVEFRPNPKTQKSSALRTVKARKLVIVSCGALGTPSVLERSGIGRPNILKKAGIEVVSALPNVGENYQDHHIMLYPYHTNLDENQTLDGLFSGRLDAGKAIQENASILGWNGQDVTGKFRPTEGEVAALGPKFQKYWDKEFKSNANKPLLLNALACL